VELFKPLAPVIPVFFLIAVGFVFAHWKKISLAPLTELIVYLGTPSLVFTSLAGKPLVATDIAVLFAGTVAMFAAVGLLIRLYFFSFRFRSRGFAMPSLFMNAGNMGLPLALFAFGQPGMQRATLLFVIITSLQYSLGIYILSGRGNWKEIFRLPLLYATIAGLSFNLGQIKTPELLFQPLALLGQSTLPLMLVGLGYRLHNFQSLQWGHALGGALLRIFGGFAAAYIAVNLVGAEGVNRQVLLLIRRSPGRGHQFRPHRKIRPGPAIGGLNRRAQHFHLRIHDSHGALADPLAAD